MASQLTGRTTLPAERSGGIEAIPATTTFDFARRLVLASTVLLSLAALGAAHAATSHKQRHLAAPATASRDIENETTGTIPTKPTPREAAAASAAGRDDESLPPPFRLPAAPRKRMRDCGLKWQAMKMSGEAGDDIWRAFATRCLSAANGPFDNEHSDR